jgi:Ni,Fe-hydrogenase maturation factor
MRVKTLVLGWGGAEVHEALEGLRAKGWRADLLEGGSMAPHVLPFLERHERVLLVGTARMGGGAGNVYRFRGEDLERFRPLADLHEAMVELELHERQPHEFMVVITEPGEGAAAALVEAAERQLRIWEGGAGAGAAAGGQ